MREGIVLHFEKRSAEANMAFDTKLLEDLDQFDVPLLHLYDWEKDSITYGHFMKPEKWLNLSYIKECNIDLAKRPTGGGFVFHMCDLAFSLLVPSSFPAFSLNTLENYAFVNQMVAEAVAEFLHSDLDMALLQNEEITKDALSKFCMAKPTKYDVVAHGKKIAGAAQRRTKKGFLHQGTIFISTLPEELLQNLLFDQDVREGILKNSSPLLGSFDPQKRDAARKSLQSILEQIFLSKVAQCLAL